MVHRIDSHDHIGVYNVDPWGEVSKFKSKSNDIAQVQWTPNGAHILAADSPLTFRVGVYAVASGSLVAVVEPYSNMLGVRTIAMHRAPLVLGTSTSHYAGFQYPLPPLQQLAAVGSFDGAVRLVSMSSWKVAHVLPLVAPQDMAPGLASELTCQVEVAVGTDKEAKKSPFLSAARGALGAAGKFAQRELKSLPR